MTNDIPKRTRILHKAADLIVGQRQEDYGTPEENFQRIADLWNTYLAKHLKEPNSIGSRQVADMMILLKVARTIQSPTEDTYIDIAGYAGIAGELSTEPDTVPTIHYSITFPRLENVQLGDFHCNTANGHYYVFKPSGWCPLNEAEITHLKNYLNSLEENN